MYLIISHQPSLQCMHVVHTVQTEKKNYFMSKEN